MSNREFTNNHIQNNIEYVQDDFSEVKIDLFGDNKSNIKDKNGDTSVDKSNHNRTIKDTININDRIGIDSDTVDNCGGTDFIEIEIE